MILIFIIHLYKNIIFLCRTKYKQDIFCYIPNILITKSALIDTKYFFKHKNYYTLDIFLQNKLYNLLTSVTALLQVLTYLPSLAVWQKDNVTFDVEMDVKWRRGLIFGGDL
jgi:hypothetical protein